MNFIIRAITYSICFLLLATANGFAFPIIGNATRVTMSSSDNRPEDFAGGEFTLTTNLDEQYASFCVEWHEHISFGTSYEVQSVEDYANEGGGPDHGATNLNEDGEYRDDLSIATKWLVNEYVNGGLKQRYAYTPGDTLGGAMQVAIWFLEHEYFEHTSEAIGYTAGGLVGEALNYTQTLNQMDASLFSNVKVVNIIDENGIKMQSQVIAGAAPVPEPATMLLLGTGLLGVAGISRKKGKK